MKYSNKKAASKVVNHINVTWHET